MPETTIAIRSNGPYLVKGPFALLDAEGNAVDLGGKSVVALCRCGASTNKPFCDASHGKIGFQGDSPAKG